MKCQGEIVCAKFTLCIKRIFNGANLLDYEKTQLMSLKKNTLWNLIGGGSPFLVGVFTIPYLLSTLGVEAFGLLTIVWALIGYFSLFDFGFGRALTQQVAAMRATESPHKIARRVKAGLSFVAITGVVGGGLLVILSPVLSQSWLNISEALQDSAQLSFMIASIGIPLATVTTGLRGVLEAYEDFKAVNILRIVLGILNFLLPVLSVIIFGPALEYAVASLVAARVLIMFMHFVLMKKKLGPYWLKKANDYSDIKALWQFGAWITVSNVIGPFMVMADRFVISSVLGAAVIAYYTVPLDSLMKLLIIPNALTVALFPKITALISVDFTAARDLYYKATAIAIKVFAPILFITAVSSHVWLSAWVGVDFADEAWLIASILSLGIFFNGVAQIPHAVIQANGNARLTALIHLTEFIFYVPLLFAAINYFGINGAAGVWVLRTIIDFSVLSIYAKNIIIARVGGLGDISRPEVRS